MNLFFNSVSDSVSLLSSFIFQRIWGNLWSASRRFGENSLNNTASSLLYNFLILFAICGFIPLLILTFSKKSKVFSFLWEVVFSHFAQKILFSHLLSDGSSNWIPYSSLQVCQVFACHDLNSHFEQCHSRSLSISKSWWEVVPILKGLDILFLIIILSLKLIKFDFSIFRFPEKDFNW